MATRCTRSVSTRSSSRMPMAITPVEQPCFSKTARGARSIRLIAVRADWHDVELESWRPLRTRQVTTTVGLRISVSAPDDSARCVRDAWPFGSTRRTGAIGFATDIGAVTGRSDRSVPRLQRAGHRIESCGRAVAREPLRGRRPVRGSGADRGHLSNEALADVHSRKHLGSAVQLCRTGAP